MMKNMLKKMMVIGVGSMLLMGSSASANELHAHRDDNRDHICDDENCKEKLSDHSGGTATCIKKAVCNICGKEYGEVDSNNHINTTLIHSIPPTCNKDGFSGFVHCLDCGTTMYDSEETIIPAGHSGGTATCASQAVCEVCGKSYGNFNGTNHAGGTELRNVKGATCTEDGYTGDTYCKGCGTQLSTGSVTLATGTGHIDENNDHYCDNSVPDRYGFGICNEKISECSGGTATCVSQAVCDICNEPYGYFDSANHAGGTELQNVKGATCTEDGYTGDRVCADCGTKIKTGTVIPATGHIDENKDHYCDREDCKAKLSECSGGTATCKDRAFCEVCGEPYGDFDSANHAGEMVTRNNKEATCEEDGYSGDIYCESCNNVVETGSELPRLGHIDEDTNHICDRETCGKVLSECTGGEATCKDLAVCEYCGHEYGEKNMNNHVGDTEIRDAKPATCEEDGYTGDTYCTSCNTKLLDGEPIAKLGHIDENKDHICDREDCKSKLSECTGGVATCKDQAICEYCNNAYGELDAANHVGDTEIRDAMEATCCEDGYTGDTYCTSCDAKLLDGTVIPALGHIDIPETETETETEKQTETETEPITEPVTEKETEKQTETEKQKETEKQTEAPKPVTPATEKVVETESAYPVAPQTGDDTPFAAVAGLLVGSGAILAGGVAIKRRRK